jgi:hypothetical protein
METELHYRFKMTILNARLAGSLQLIFVFSEFIVVFLNKV